MFTFLQTNFGFMTFNLYAYILYNAHNTGDFSLYGSFSLDVHQISSINSRHLAKLQLRLQFLGSCSRVTLIALTSKDPRLFFF